MDSRIKQREQADSSMQRAVLVPVDRLKAIHRDLDACQKVIWMAGCRPRGYGFDPAYVADAQERLKEIEALLAAPIAQSPQEQSGLVDLLRVLERTHAGHMVGHDQSDQPRGGYSDGYVKGFGACIEVVKKRCAALSQGGE